VESSVCDTPFPRERVSVARSATWNKRRGVHAVDLDLVDLLGGVPFQWKARGATADRNKTPLLADSQAQAAPGCLSFAPLGADDHAASKRGGTDSATSASGPTLLPAQIVVVRLVSLSPLAGCPASRPRQA
jgi:hypothetical protein